MVHFLCPPTTKTLPTSSPSTCLSLRHRPPLHPLTAVSCRDPRSLSRARCFQAECLSPSRLPNPTPRHVQPPPRPPRPRSHRGVRTGRQLLQHRLLTPARCARPAGSPAGTGGAPRAIPHTHPEAAAPGGEEGSHRACPPSRPPLLRGSRPRRCPGPHKHGPTPVLWKPRLSTPSLDAPLPPQTASHSQPAPAEALPLLGPLACPLPTQQAGRREP